jgi:hypothetical protein
MSNLGKSFAGFSYTRTKVGSNHNLGSAIPILSILHLDQLGSLGYV